MDQNVKERWYKPVNRIGRITMVMAMVASFGPFLYLYLKYGELPIGSQVAQGIIAVVSAYAVYYVVEPISYFPALGTAGSYMGILAGSIAQMRVPAALIAKNVANVEENTQEAEIVATAGIAGSVFTNIIVTTLTAILGSWLLVVIPDAVKENMRVYVLPAIYGGVGAMLATNLKLFVPALCAMLILNFMQRNFLLTFLPTWSMVLFGVIVGVGWGRFAYAKLKWIK